MKGRGKKILDTPNRKNASKIPHHHLNIFLMGIFLFIFLRLVKNTPASAEAATRRQADAS
jgi:hypothetical protein